MNELWLQIYGYWCGIQRYRWYAILVAWIIAIAGWTFVIWIPNQYQSSARVYVDTDSLLRPLMKGLAVRPNIDQRLSIMTRTLLSRPNLEKVMRRTDMDLSVTSPEGKDKLLKQLEAGISIKASRDNLYVVSYQNNDPQLARHVVQSILNIFVEKILGSSRKDSNTAQQFIEQQIKAYGKLLDTAEKRLMDFKRKHVGEMPDERGNYYQRLQSESHSLKVARTGLNMAINRRDELKLQLAGKEPVFGFGNTLQADSGNPNSPINARIQTLQEQLDEVLLKYTDKYPAVTTLREKIAMLSEQKKRHSPLPEKSQSEADSSNGIDTDNYKAGSNFYYQQMQISLAEANADVASRKAQVDALAENVKELRERVDTIPKVEAELASLNRDYGIYKENYNKLLARREAAKMGGEVDDSPESVKFRVVDPPTRPLLPSSPNRPLLIALVLVVAGGVGVAFAFLLSQLRPVFYTRRDLEEITGLPVLGSVSMVLLGRALWKRRFNFIAFLFACGLLIAGCGLLASNYLFDMRIFDIIKYSMA